MKYYAKFDGEGTRITSVVEGVHFTDETGLQKYLDDGFIEISEVDQELYITGEYIRDTESGRPIQRTVIPEQPAEQPHANIDPSILALAEAVAAQEMRLAVLEGGAKA